MRVSFSGKYLFRFLPLLTLILLLLVLFNYYHYYYHKRVFTPVVTCVFYCDGESPYFCYGRESFNPYMPGVFQFGIFLSISLSNSWCMFDSRPSSSSSNPFFYIIYQYKMFFPFSYFTPKFFAFGLWLVLVLSPPIWWLNFLLLLWKVLFCLYCLTLPLYLLSHQYLLVYLIQLYR